MARMQTPLARLRRVLVQGQKLKRAWWDTNEEAAAKAQLADACRSQDAVRGSRSREEGMLLEKHAYLTADNAWLKLELAKARRVIALLKANLARSKRGR